MVKVRLTVERSVMDESNWKPVGDLAASILRTATERREKLVEFKAAVARDHADALPPASGAIWVQLELPFAPAPVRVRPDIRIGRISRF
jgi:hypothetical protein